jgi:hypothetical protein
MEIFTLTPPAAGAAGGTSATDKATYTPGTSTGTPVIGAVDETTPDVATEGTLAIIRATLNRALHVNLRDAGGAELSVGGGTQYTEDAVAAANPTGNALIVVRNDARSGALVSADGDNIALRGTNSGEMYVKQTDVVPVSDNGGSLTVDGTVTAIAQPGVDIGDVTVNNAAGAAAVNIQDGGNSLTVDGTITANLAAGTNNIGDVDVLTVPAPLNLVGGGIEAAALRVTIANDSTGVLSVDDNGGSLTVDGTIAATQSGTWTVQPGNTANTTPWLASIHDGTTKATVRDLATNDALNVAIVDAGGAHITSFGGGTQFAEDLAHISGDVGTLSLAVRRDANTTFVSADGDYSPLAIDANGNLKVNIIAGGGSGGTSSTDEATYTPTTSLGTPIMGAADETAPDAAAEGTLAIIRSTLNRALHVNLRDAAGAELSVGGGTQYTEDAASAADPVGTIQMMVRQDTPASEVSANGDNIAARSNSAGAQYVELLSGTAKVGGDATNGLDVDVTRVQGTVTIAGAVTNAGTFAVQESGAALTSLQLIDDAIFAEDVAAIAADKGIAVLAVRRDADTSLVGTDNDYANLQVNNLGALKVEIFDGGDSHTVDGTIAFSNATIAVTNVGTFVVQENGAALTALQLIDNIVHTEDEASADGHSGVVMLARRTAAPANTSGADLDYEVPQMSAGRLWTSSTIDAAIPAGNNNIGDVDVVSNIPGTGATNLGKAEDAVHASGDTGVYALAVRDDAPAAHSGTDGDYESLHVSSDGGLWITPFPTSGANGLSVSRLISAASTNETEAKAAAGALYGVICTNINAAVRYLKIYNNTASGTAIGTTTPFMTVAIPGNTAGAGFVWMSPFPIAMSTGITFGLTTGVADADTGAVAANEIVVNLFYK